LGIDAFAYYIILKFIMLLL